MNIPHPPEIALPPGLPPQMDAGLPPPHIFPPPGGAPGLLGPPPGLLPPGGPPMLGPPGNILLRPGFPGGPQMVGPPPMVSAAAAGLVTGPPLVSGPPPGIGGLHANLPPPMRYKAKSFSPATHIF